MNCYTLKITDVSNLNIPSQFIEFGTVTVDLLEDGLTLVNNKQELSDLNNIKIDGVVALTVPATPKNVLLFERYFDSSTPDFNPAPLSCRLMKGATPMRQRFCFPTFQNDQDGTIEVQLSYNQDHWVPLIAQLKLNQVPLQDFTLSRLNITQSWANHDALAINNNSIVFPPVYYGGTYETRAVTSSDFRPWLNIVSFLKLALCGVGWKLQGTILDNHQFRYLSVYHLRKDYAQIVNIDDYKFLAKIEEEKRFINQENGIELPLIEQFDLKNMFDESQAFQKYTGSLNIYDEVILKYEIQCNIFNDSGIVLYDENLGIEPESINIVYSTGDPEQQWATKSVKIDSKGQYKGELKIKVSNFTEGFIAYPALAIVGGDYSVKQFEFFNNPIHYKYKNGDVIDISSELDPDLSVLDVLKGFVHTGNLKFDTNFESKTITVYPAEKVELLGVVEDGYNIDDSDIIKKVVSKSMITYSPAGIVERFQEYDFKSTSGAAFKNNEYDNAFKASIDLGDAYQEKTKNYPNPLYNATIIQDVYNLNQSANQSYNPVFLPNVATTEGQINLNITARMLIFQWQQQRRTGSDFTVPYNRLVWANENNEPIQGIDSYFILGYQDLSLHPELEVSGHPQQPTPFNFDIVLNYKNLYNSFYKSQLAEYVSPKTSIQFVLNPDEFFSFNFRKRKQFIYKGKTYSLRPISASSDVCGIITEVQLVGELKGIDLCDSPIGDGDPPVDNCANYPSITITNVGTCQEFTLQGVNQSTITGVAFEYRYQNSDGTFPATWTPLANTGVLTSELCNATALYEVRANVSYDDDCPNLSTVSTYDPCQNYPVVFFNPFLNGTTGEQCFSANIGGTFGSTITSTELFYSVNGGTTIPYTENEEVCLTGLQGDIQICLEGTINYDGNCVSSEVQKCYTFPIDNPDCSLTTLIPVCVQGSSATCFTFDTAGNLSAGAATVVIKYKCGIDGDEFIYIGNEVCCPNGDLYAQVVITYCNSLCPIYCSDWVQCTSTCDAVASVTHDCCVIDLTMTNCGNPIIVWQEAQIGGNDWTNISGAISDQLNIFDYFPTEDRKYRAQVQCDGCNVLYSPVTEIIHSVSVTQDGCDLTATIAGIACTPVNYIWQKSLDSGETWEVVATGDGLNMITADDDALYRVIVSYGGCSRTSNELQMDCDVCDDISVTIEKTDCCTLGIESTTATSPSYQWQVLIGGSYADIGGETADTLSITENGTYRLCITTVDCTSPIYSNAIIIFYDVEITGTDCDKVANVIGGCDDVTYNWQILNTTTNPSTWDDLNITTENATFDQNGTIRVVVTFGNCIIIESDPVVIECDLCDPTIIIGSETCTINLLTLTGCENATYQLQKLVGANWVDVAGITSLPYQVTENASYRIEVTCVCGVFYSNVLDITCCESSMVIAQGENNPCYMFVQSFDNCGNTGGTLWEKSCDSGGTWEVVQTSTFDYTATENCWYRARRNVNGCQCISNILMVDCNNECDPITKVDGVCEIDYTLPCINGQWGFYKLENGSWNVVSSGNGVVPTNFQITSNGIYKLSVICADGCIVESPISSFNNCESDPCDDIEFTLTLTNCVLIANVTNCPNPVYTFKLNGNTLQSGGNNSYSVTQNGLYTVEVTGCTGCALVSEQQNVTGCSNNGGCNCSASISETDCGLLVSSTTNCNGYGGTWQKSANGSTGWSIVAGTTSSYQATENAFYRLVRNKSGCPDVISNIIQVTCITNNCTPTININLINDGCQLQATWSGCEGTPSIAEWNYASNNGANCNTCTGWTIVQGGQTSFNGNGTGTSTITPNNGTTCYRFVLSCCDGSGPISACVHWDESGCVVIQERLVFHNVHANPPSVLVGSEYELESLIVNGVTYFSGLTDITPTSSQVFDSYTFESSFRNKLNSYNIPNWSARLPTSIERAIVTTQGASVSQGLSVVVTYIQGQSWYIKYTRAIEDSEIWTFEITESSSNLIVQDSNLVETYNGPPGGYWNYFWSPDVDL